MIGIGLSLPQAAVRRRGANQAPRGAPIPQTFPVISGSPERGQRLTASTGTWTNSPTGYSYQWKRNGAAIPGATNADYMLVAADDQAMVGVTVWAVNGAGSNYANATAVGPVKAPVVATVFRDDFKRPDENLEDGSSWKRVSGTSNTLRVSNGQLQTLSGEAAYICPPRPTPDHYVQAKIAGGGAVGPFLVCRLTDQDNWGAATRFNLNTGAAQMWKRVGGVLTQMGGNLAGQLATVGSTIRLEVVGDTAQLFRDGAPLSNRFEMGGAGAGVKTCGIVPRTNANNPWLANFEADSITAHTE